MDGISQADIRRLKGRVPSLGTALNRELKAALKDQGLWWRNQMDNRFRAPLPAFGQKNTNTSLHNRTNALRSSMYSRVQGAALTELTLKMASRSPYAPTHEFGKTIKARRSKFMAIPIDDNLTPAGARRYSSPLDPEIQDGFFIKHDDGTLYYVRWKDGDLKYLFVLRKSVKIPARLGMGERAVGKNARIRLRAKLRGAMNRAVQGALGNG